jgi:hypothetical protein
MEKEWKLSDLRDFMAEEFKRKRELTGGLTKQEAIEKLLYARENHIEVMPELGVE